MNAGDGYAQVLAAAIEALRPDPPLHVDAWAEEYAVVPASAARPGPFRFSHSYPARRIHQVLSPHDPCRRVVARVASQMFKTQTALNWIGSLIHLRPRNILALQPTDTLVRRFSARVAQMIRSSPVLHARVARAKSRSSRNTVQAKDFLGDATLYMHTAGSAANLAEVSACWIYVDEIDRLLLDVQGEGDPVELAEARAAQYGSRAKFFYTSSPSIEGASRIDSLFDKGTQERYHVPCPHCGHLHELVAENFHWQRAGKAESGRITRAWFTCPACGADIEEHHKAVMLPDDAAGGKARWVAASSGDGETVSFHLNAFYMPPGALGWLQLARQYASAQDLLGKGDPSAMQVFSNTRLAQSWRAAQSSSTAAQLQARAEDWPARVLPMAALVLTAATDTQDKRLEVQLHAWGPGLEHWVIDYIVLHGSPAEAPEVPGSVWQRLDEILQAHYLHASGARLRISALAIDAGGNHTQAVYNWGQARQRQGVVIIGGANRAGRPIIASAPALVDVTWGGKKRAGGAQRWAVGTDVAKDWLHARMALEAGPGAMHWHHGLPPDWFAQMCAEAPRLVHKNGRVRREWHKTPGARNEAWDLSVYNLAMAHKLGLHQWSALDWQRLRARITAQHEAVQAGAGRAAQAPAPARRILSRGVVL